MAENPGLTSHRAYDPEGRQAEGLNPDLPAKGWARVFQSKPPSFIRSEGSPDMGRSSHSTLRWHQRPGHWLAEPAFQQLLPSHAGSLGRLTLRASSAKVTKGQQAAFPTFCQTQLRGGNKTRSHQKREVGMAQWEGDRILETPQRFGFDSWLCHGCHMQIT